MLSEVPMSLLCDFFIVKIEKEIFKFLFYFQESYNDSATYHEKINEYSKTSCIK
jgi:hypothetical protein